MLTISINGAPSSTLSISNSVGDFTWSSCSNANSASLITSKKSFARLIQLLMALGKKKRNKQTNKEKILSSHEESNLRPSDSMASYIYVNKHPTCDFKISLLLHSFLIVNCAIMIIDDQIIGQWIFCSVQEPYFLIFANLQSNKRLKKETLRFSHWFFVYMHLSKREIFHSYKKSRKFFTFFTFLDQSSCIKS